MPETIGVVAIGRNEGERLQRCLASMPLGIPLVYVDSGSTDDSLSIARAADAQIVELDLATPFTAARARNAGAQLLTRANPSLDYIQFVDGDCELECGWFAKACETLTVQARVAAVCGRRRERFREASLYNRLADEEWNTPIGKAAACGGDALFRKSAFEDVGGFDERMIAGEEPELCHRLRLRGWTIQRIDAPMTIHDAAMHQFGQWWLRAVRSGFGYAQVFFQTRASGRPLYRRELARTLFWTAGVVLFAIGATILFGPRGLLVAPLLWLLQWARLTVRDGPAKACLLLLGKAAELVGIVRLVVAKAQNRRSGTILYK